METTPALVGLAETRHLTGLNQVSFKQILQVFNSKSDNYGQWHALIDCYGRHRRPVARSN